MGYDPEGLINRDAAIEYAKKWYNSHNPDYPDYGDDDCANFVSQCLKTGGYVNDDIWYCRWNTGWSYWAALHPKYRHKQWDHSNAWSCAKEHYEFFSDAANGCKYGSTLVFSSKKEVQDEASSWGITKGDLMYFVKKGESNVSHATIIVRVDSNDLIFSGHSGNTFDGSLASTIGGYEKVYVVRLK